MKKTRHSIAFIACLLLVTVSAFSQSSSSKTEKIKTLMDLIGSTKQYKQTMDVMFSSLSKNSSNLPKGFLESFAKEMDIDGLRMEMAPIYNKHFTETDIDGMITFYQSEIGKKMINTMPVIMGELMPIIQARVQTMTERMRNSMDQKSEKTK